MNIKDFNKLVGKELNKIEEILSAKTSEYNSGEDRLSIFKRAGFLEDRTPEQALLGFVAKQITSIYEMVNTKNTYHEDIWSEKIIDVIVYMILLKAALVDSGRCDCEERWS